MALNQLKFDQLETGSVYPITASYALNSSGGGGGTWEWSAGGAGGTNAGNGGNFTTNLGSSLNGNGGESLLI